MRKILKGFDFGYIQTADRGRLTNWFFHHVCGPNVKHMLQISNRDQLFFLLFEYEYICVSNSFIQILHKLVNVFLILQSHDILDTKVTLPEFRDFV